LVEFERFCIEVLKAEHPEVFEGSGGRLDPIRAGNLLSGMCGVDSTTLLEQALIELLFDADVVEIARLFGGSPRGESTPERLVQFPSGIGRLKERSELALGLRSGLVAQSLRLCH
jgi:hypothetical protein